MRRADAVDPPGARPAARRATRPAARRVVGGLLAVTLLAVPLACGAPGDVDAVDAGRVDGDPAAAAARAAQATWTDGATLIASREQVRGRIDLAAGADRVTVRLRNARVVSIPEQCDQSTVTKLRSYIDGRMLVCRLVRGTTSLPFSAIVVGADAASLGGDVKVRDGARVTSTSLPDRLIVGGTATIEPDLRVVSSPDFLNADVGDLRDGPNRWNPRRSTNSTNAQYERALDSVLDDWEALDPAAVLVAGDLVNGRWGYDDLSTGTFGPVDTLPQRRAAIRRAARTYYPQWLDRFTERDLDVFPSIGDHEYGDNPWPLRKRKLASTYRSEFAREFTTNPDGSFRYGSHPRGQSARTAFAGRPSPDLQIISLDVFDITPERARIRLDREQMRWFQQVLRQAKRDKVKWIVVESHVPVIFPVRSRGSSMLHYEGGTDSRLWRLMKRYGVDVYLSGEVHDTQVAEQDGIVQVSHGGAFQYGLTTALVMDFYGDNLYLTLRDYDLNHHDVGQRLWETRRSGMPRDVSIERPALTIGTASVRDGRLVDASGILTPLN